MEKIKKIIIENENIKMEFGDRELSIPLKQDYVKKIINKALEESKEDLQNLSFYKKCANICLYPLLGAIGMFIGAYVAKFIAMDLVLIMCGGLAGMSLVGYSVFKFAEAKTEEHAYNNEYWLEIRDLAINKIKHGKDNKKKKTVTKTNNYQKSNNKVNHFYNNLTEEDEMIKSSRKL